MIFGKCGNELLNCALTENASDEAAAKFDLDTKLYNKNIKHKHGDLTHKYLFFLKNANTLAYMDDIDSMFSDFKDNDYKTMCSHGGKERDEAQWILINVAQMIAKKRVDLFYRH